MMFYAKVRWIYDDAERVDEIFFTADDYADAAVQVKKHFTYVVAMSLYEFDNDILCVSDYEDSLDEARKAVV